MRNFSLENARLELQKIRKNKTVVLTAGTFDLIHPGHIAYLQFCKSRGDLLVVCVVGDKRTRRRKKAGRPIVKQEWRALIVSTLKPVDLVFISDRRPFEEEIIDTIRPDVVITPSDEPSAERKAEFASYLHTNYPEVKLIMRSRSSFRQNSSTSNIIGKVQRYISATKRRKIRG